MKNILVIDTETTGLDPTKNSVWQIGAVLRKSDGSTSMVNFKCKPTDLDNISEDALRVCKTTREELENLPPAEEMYKAFRLFLLENSQQEKLTWIGYNCKFDQTFIQLFLKSFDVNDSIWNYFTHHSVDLLEYTKLLKCIGILESPNAKIETLYKLFGVSTETSHDAVEDAKVTFSLYQWAESSVLKGVGNAKFVIQ